MEQQAGGMKTEEGRAMLERVRSICAEFPESTELVDGHGHTVYKVKSKSFIMMRDGIMHIKSTPENAEILLQDARFFRTPYIGQHGWISINHLEEWEMIADLLEEAYLLAAPKGLAKAWLQSKRG
ncbi:phosphoribosylglycinamide formyltransferase [Paenibacillus agaridevorans]|uniref:Phosphoribosylglycinamide formyltransferase n=1 Tax=Paenibacillus agaridevorans TaxID=171404 RepID=A0A2R5F4S4_9BACL|nr:MmcQ/YjbR family DNA-binding protein [Paenibacillus agaridevorans]GBG11683.1 phosphoribosylglycinamide formyltransferase [Paenibacillus agaridevorans]